MDDHYQKAEETAEALLKSLEERNVSVDRELFLSNTRVLSRLYRNRMCFGECGEGKVIAGDERVPKSQYEIRVRRRD